MPVHSDTNGMGAQIPTEKYGVRSPFQAGGGGGGGGSGGGSGAATQVWSADRIRFRNRIRPRYSRRGKPLSRMRRVRTPPRRQLPNDELRPPSQASLGSSPTPCLDRIYAPRGHHFTELSRKLYSFPVGRGVKRPPAVRVRVDVERLVRWGYVRVAQITVDQHVCVVFGANHRMGKDSRHDLLSHD